MASKSVEADLPQGMPLPLNVADPNLEAWKGGVRFEEGTYKFRARRWKLYTRMTDKGQSQSIGLFAVCIEAPEEHKKFVGQEHMEIFNISAESNAKNYYYGFLQEIGPEAVKPENCMNVNGEARPRQEFFVGNAAIDDGAVFEAAIYHDKYKDAKDPNAKEQVNARFVRNTVKLIDRAAPLKQFLGQAGAQPQQPQQPGQQYVPGQMPPQGGNSGQQQYVPGQMPGQYVPPQG